MQSTNSCISETRLESALLFVLEVTVNTYTHTHVRQHTHKCICTNILIYPLAYKMLKILKI